MTKNLKKEEKKIELFIGIILILIGIILRFLPHKPNFTSISGIALFGGVYLTRNIALCLPLIAMIFSDFILGFYEPALMLSVYGSFIICVLVGFRLKKNKKWHNILAGSILCSLIFFFVTNFAVWAFTPWYEKTISGLIECFMMGLPFFKNTLRGDLFYAGIFFGIYEVAGFLVKKSVAPTLVYEKSSISNTSSGEI